MRIEYVETPEFKKDLKKLSKRFASLPVDLKTAQKAAIELLHIHGIDNKSIFEIPRTGAEIRFYKLKKFACRSLKGKGSRTGIRIVYAYDSMKGMIYLLEMYYKGDKKSEDRARIRALLKDWEKT